MTTAEIRETDYQELALNCLVVQESKSSRGNVFGDRNKRLAGRLQVFAYGLGEHG